MVNEWRIKAKQSLELEQKVERLLNESPRVLLEGNLPVGRYLDTIKRVLDAISESRVIGFKALLRKCRKMSPYTLQAFLAPLKKRGAVKITPASRIGKKMEITIGEKFSEVLEIVSERLSFVLRYKTLTLGIDGGRRGKIVIEFEHELGVEETYKIIEHLGLSPSIFNFLLRPELGNANIRINTQQNPPVEKFEDEMWRHIIKISVRFSGKSEEYFEKAKLYKYRLPDTFAYAFGLPQELGELRGYYQEYWRLANPEQPRSQSEINELLCFIRSQNEEVKSWIRRRRREDPDFFVPSSIWLRCGFPGEKKWSGRVSLPHNILITEPKFASTLYMLYCLLEWLAFQWKMRKRYRWYFTDFYTKDLRKIQNSMDFFFMWKRFWDHEFYKQNREIFEPIDCAFEKYRKTGVFTNLAQLYQDLFHGVLTPRGAVKAVKSRKYELCG